jgi:hypothetical protein
MRLEKVRTKIIGSALVSLLILATGLGVNGVPQGHRGRNWDGYPNLGGSFDLRQTALNAGYNEGSKEGRKDRDKRRYSDFQDFDSYRNATKDYSSKLGDRDLYQRYFRMAFESGYDTENARPGGQGNSRPGNWDRNNRRGRDWDRYGTYGGSFELRQTALNAGYNEGIKQGRNDGKKGRRKSYRDYSSYQKGTDDYSSKLGDKELYRRYYREGFENGYEDGYNGY